jgi:hypothetical protein
MFLVLPLWQATICKIHRTPLGRNIDSPLQRTNDVRYLLL